MGFCTSYQNHEKGFNLRFFVFSGRELCSFNKILFFVVVAVVVIVIVAVVVEKGGGSVRLHWLKYLVCMYDKIINFST